VPLTGFALAGCVDHKSIDLHAALAGKKLVEYLQRRAPRFLTVYKTLDPRTIEWTRKCQRRNRHHEINERSRF
jgi:hypothetical protein